MWIYTRVGSEGECPRDSLNHFYGAFPLGFLQPIILIHLVLSPYLLCLRILLCMHMYLLAKMDSTEKACGQLASLTMGWHPSSHFDLEGGFLHMLSPRGPLSSETPAIRQIQRDQEIEDTAHLLLNLGLKAHLCFAQCNFQGEVEVNTVLWT